MRKLIFILLAFTLFFYVSCEDEEPTNNEDPTPDNKEVVDETTYESGIIIDTYTADVDANKFESQADAQRVSIVPTEESQTKSKSGDFYMVCDNGIDAPDTLNVENGGFVVFNNISRIIPLNADYFLVGDNVEVTVTTPTYQDVSEYDSILVADYLNQDVIKDYNIVDTIVNSSNDTLLAYYDTVTVVTETTEQNSYSNLIFSKTTGDVFDLDDNIWWDKSKSFQNTTLNTNIENTHVYYINESDNIVDLDLSSNTPIKTERFNSTNYGVQIRTGGFRVFDENVAFIDDNSERIVTISKNSKYDYIDDPSRSGAEMFSYMSSVYYLSYYEDQQTIFKISIVNDTISREVEMQGSDFRTEWGWNSYLFKYADKFYNVGFSGNLCVTSFNPFSVQTYQWYDNTVLPNQYLPTIVKQIGQYVVFFDQPTLYKINLLDGNYTTILDNYNIFNLEVNNDQTMEFYGFSLIDGYYVHAKVDLSGNLEIISTSEYDTSPIILTNIF